MKRLVCDACARVRGTWKTIVNDAVLGFVSGFVERNYNQAGL